MEQEKGTTGKAGYTNDGNLSARDEALFQLARMEQENGTTGLLDYDNDGTTGTADLEIFNKARLERFSPTGGANIYRTEYTDNYQPKVITDHKDDVISGGTYEGVDSDELEPYRGMYLPDDGLNINLPQGPVGTVFAQFNKPTTWDNPDAFESDNFNMVTVTDTPYKTNNEINLKNVDALQGPVGSTKLNPNEIWFNDEPLNLSTGNYRNGNNHNKHLFDIKFTNNDNNDYVPTEQYGIDEAVVDASKYIKEKAGDAYKYATNLFSSDNADTNGEPSIWKPSQLGQINADLYGTSPGWGNMRIWENPPEPDYGGMTMPPSLQEGGDEDGKMFYDALQQVAREEVITNPNASADTSNSLINSMIKKELEKKREKELSQQFSKNISKIAQRIIGKTPVTYTSYGPPNMQRVGGRYGL
jgi:hypothetical protein